MARYVGDTFVITGSVTDVTGALADATSVSVSIQLPDGTSVGPFTPQHPGTGTYTYAHTSTQAGMHTAVFTATGTNNAGAPISFYVYPIAGGLVSPEEVRAHLRISPASWTTYQTRLLSWIAASRVLIEDEVGSLALTTYDEWYDGGAATIMLLESPIASVTSVTETFGANVVRTLTMQPIDGQQAVNAYGYTADYATGQLVRRVTGIAAPFALGRRNVHVVYAAGTAGVWRENYRLANLEQLRIWWLASQDGNNPQPLSGAAYDETVQDLHIGGLSPRVMQMLGRRTRTEGIA